LASWLPPCFGEFGIDGAGSFSAVAIVGSVTRSTRSRAILTHGGRRRSRPSRIAARLSAHLTKQLVVAYPEQ
jgi:hypothetical protein